MTKIEGVVHTLGVCAVTSKLEIPVSERYKMQCGDCSLPIYSQEYLAGVYRAIVVRFHSFCDFAGIADSYFFEVELPNNHHSGSDTYLKNGLEENIFNSSKKMEQRVSESAKRVIDYYMSTQKRSQSEGYVMS